MTAPAQPPADPPAGEPDLLDSDEAGGKAIRGGATRTAGYVASLALSLLALPFLIRHLGVVDYGKFVIVSSVVFVISGITDAGLTNLGVREYAVRPPRERDLLLRHLVGLRLALTFAGVVLATALMAVTGAERVVVEGTFISGLALLVFLTQQTYTIPLTAQLRLGWPTLLEILRQGCLTALILVLVSAGATLVPFFWAQVAAAAVMAVATIAILRGQAPLLPAFDRRTWATLARETLPYAAAAAVGIIHFRLVVILSSYVMSEEETGYFGAAFRIIEVLVTVPWLVVSTGFPILARSAQNDEQRFGAALQGTFEIALLIGVGLALGLFVGAPFAIDVLAGKGFEPSVDVLRIQSLVMVTAFLVMTWLFALLSLRLFRAILVAGALAVTVVVAATLALASVAGADGAAVATVVAEVVLVAACLVGLLRARPELRPRLRIVPKVGLAAALGLAPALLLPLPPVVLVLLAGGIYLAALVLTRAIPQELLNALPGRGPRG